MTRRKSREAAFQIVFEMSINDINAEQAIELVEETGEPELDYFAKKLIVSFEKHREDIDNIYRPFLLGWSMERISKTSLALLRISCAQLFFWDEVGSEDNLSDEMSEKVIINEAVDLAKKYGLDDDYSFINGVLGNVVRSRE